MSFYHINEFNPDWANNQGFINSMTVRLYQQNKNELLDYVQGLTVDQRDQARSHLETILRLQHDNQ